MGRIRLLIGISIFWLPLSLLFDGINTLVLPNDLERVVGDDAKATVLGLVTFSGLLVGMMIQPVAGAASDRLRARWGRLGSLTVGATLTLVALAIYGAANALLVLIVGYVLVQATSSAAQAAQQGLLPDLVPPESRGTAAGLKSLLDISGALLGFVLLGQLLGESRSVTALLVIGGVMAAALLLTVWLVREPILPAASPAPRPTLVDVFRFDLARHDTFARLVLARFLFLLGTYAVGRFWLYFVADRLGLDRDHAAEQAGLLLAAVTLVTVLAALPAGWLADRLGRMPLMVGGGLVSAAGVLGLVAAATAWQIALCGSVMALGSAAFASASWALTADLVPPDEAGRFFGLANVSTAGAAAAAGLFGPLMDHAPGSGYEALFAGAALAFVASAVVARGMVAAAVAHRPVVNVSTSRME
jgi:MFS family permease